MINAPNAATDLAGFLLARLAEDEEVALEAETRPFLADEPNRWWTYDRLSVLGVWASSQPNGSGRRVAYVSTEPERDHIVRHDPARVLAECEARRRILEQAEVWGDHLVDVLRCLALPYAEHPDYREEWRP